MSSPFIGEIQLFGFNFAPMGFSQCNGAVMSISQNTALFSLLGTYYGGNGQNTYQLPNLMTRAACSQGSGVGLSPRTIGENFGEDTVTLLASEMPMHNHVFDLHTQRDVTKRTNVPSAGASLLIPTQISPFLPNVAPNTSFAPSMLSPIGGSLPHENDQPYLAINYCIALTGIFPAFS
ncbi:phage tail protein [Dyella tabacisoli]|uniref:Microcystin-dependent protein n=1 Tax=Dyella tabacisoli TaxID=2282381 RepID=A0A369UJX6_9GAMM|nr:tail fiber protein [Dyella tabacisoli]RDD81074.1 microcystin-dependent protein [Dyella tabacisoli]